MPELEGSAAGEGPPPSRSRRSAASPASIGTDPAEPPPTFDAVLLAAVDASIVVGGISLVERAALTLARAGARRLLCLGPNPPARLRLPGLPIAWAAGDDAPAIAAWAAGATAFVVAADARTVVDPATLAALARAPAGGPLRVVGAPLWRVPRADVPPLAAGATPDGRTAGEAVAVAATTPWHPPPDALLVYVADEHTRAQAERLLYARLGRAGDGWFTRHVDRRISRALTRLLLPTGISPNQITLLSMIIGMAGGVLLATGGDAAAVIGASLFLFSTILDGCDGEIARLTFRESRLGAQLDLVADNLVHVVLFAGIAIGLYRRAPTTRIAALGIVLVSGALAAMATVYWAFVHRTPNAAQRALFEAFASREFAYLLVLLAAAGKLEWFLWAAAIGTYGFVAALLVLRRRQHPAG